MAVKSFLLMALAIAALAQPAGRGLIAGTVIDTASGDPVRKAIVTVTWHGTPRSWATLRTDESGQFRFEGLPPGKYDLRASKSGTGEATYGAGSARELGELITLGDGETLAGLKLRFVHLASIAGRVFDSDGDPVAGAQITLLRPGRNLGVPVLSNYQSVILNDRGEYQFTGIAPGEYYLRSEPLRAGSFQFRVGRPGDAGVDPEAARQIVLGAYYGGARDSKDASKLTIRGGETLTGIDLHLVSEPAAQLIAHLTGIPPATLPEDGGGRRFGGNVVEIQIRSLDDNNNFQSGADSQGKSDLYFNVPALAPGRYRVQGLLQGAPVLEGAQTVDLHSGANDIEIALAPGMELKGQVHLEGPPAATRGASREQIVLSEPGVRGDAVRAVPGKDGRFTLRPVFPGERELDVTGLARGSFLKSVRLGDKDILFTPFDLESADAALNIVISTNTAKIEGEIDAGGADPGRAGIVLAPVGRLHEFARFYYSSIAGDDGKFKMEGIAPGKYRLYALEKMAPAGFRNPEAADKLEPLGQEIELKEGETAQANPKLIPRERAREALP